MVKYISVFLALAGLIGVSIHHEHMLGYFVIAGVGWLFASILYYILLTVAFTWLAQCIAGSNKNLWRIQLFSGIIFTVIGMMLVLSLSAGNGYFNYQVNALFILILGAMVLGLSIFGKKHIHPIISIGKKMVMMVFLILSVCGGIGYSLIIQIPYVENYEAFEALPGGDLEASQVAEVLSINKKEFNGKYELLVFASTTCPHCKRIVRLLEAQYRADNDFVPITVILGGTDKHYQEYLEATNSTMQEIRTDDSDAFFTLTRGSVPLITLFVEGKLVKVWNGMTFNYNALDYLSSLD